MNRNITSEKKRQMILVCAGMEEWSLVHFKNPLACAKPALALDSGAVPSPLNIEFVI